MLFCGDAPGTRGADTDSHANRAWLTVQRGKPGPSPDLAAPVAQSPQIRANSRENASASCACSAGDPCSRHDSKTGSRIWARIHRDLIRTRRRTANACLVEPQAARSLLAAGMRLRRTDEPREPRAAPDAARA